MVGWTLGGGGEFALTNYLSLKGEVLYVDLGSYNATVAATNDNVQNLSHFRE